MKVAVIDMGTNTFHLILVEVEGQSFDIFYREKVAVKIGEKGINKGFITSDAQERALTTLSNFQNTIKEHKVGSVYATATSAIRNAKNGQELVNRIKQETGIEARVISGLQEAEYIYFGVKQALEIGDTPSLIMDIGGGSIEFIIGTSSKVYWKQSFEIGGQRLMEKFQKSDPIQPKEIEELIGYLENHLEELLEACEMHKPKTLIGSSGTFDTLSDMYLNLEKIEGKNGVTELPLTIEGFNILVEKLILLPRKERLKIAGMIPLRVDMIVVASILIRFVLESTKLERIRVSAYALKEGVLLSTLDSLHQKQD